MKELRKPQPSVFNPHRLHQWLIQTRLFGGKGKSKREAPKSLHVSTCLNTPGSLLQSLDITQVVTFLVGQGSGFSLVELCDVAVNHHSLKSPHIINSQDV